jgi:hypothetical protein
MAKARRAKRITFGRGGTVPESTFRAHAGAASEAFAAHSTQALTTPYRAGSAPWKAPKPAAFKSAMPSAGAAWTAGQKKARKFRAAKPKIV